MYKIGIDVGGTFTDFMLSLDEGVAETYKTLTTPEDPSIGLFNGLQEMADAHKLSLKEFLKKVSTIVHGTTVTTNAVLTGSGARTGLLTTRGLRDALEMRRGIRERQYDNRFTNVTPLVPRHLRLPVKERLDYSGKELIPLDVRDVEAAVKKFKTEGVQSLAVCFMNSFANDAHEKKAAAILRKRFPGTYLTVSSELLPAIRFYDRISTTALNSYVGPILKNYLDSLVKRLEDAGYGGVLLIMQSNGGVISPEIAMDHAAVTLLSGPAGGPVAGMVYTAVQGYDDCITVDMGGTSFDAALIKDRTPLLTTEGEVDRMRLALPMLGIVTIGAGGGSIGWMDEGGLLRMGPKSAGAKPGPACYGFGGALPCCTDADLLLGYLDKDYFAGGRMPLYPERSTKAIREKLCEKLGMDAEAVAAGMYDIINVNMAAGVREVSVKRGQDPREFPLVVAGGAGPIHACQISHELEIPVMLVPKESSIFCASGMLMSDLKHDLVRTYAVLLELMDKARFRRLFDEMEREAKRLLASENIPEEKVRHSYFIDLRYVKQYHEVSVRITKEELEQADPAVLAARFHPEHNRLYGYSLENELTKVELINMRLSSIGLTDKPRLPEEKYQGEDSSHALKRKRRIWLPVEKRFEQVPVYDGHKLKFGNRLEGPALIEQVNTSTFVSPEYSIITDRLGSYTMYLKGRDEFARRVK